MSAGRLAARFVRVCRRAVASIVSERCYLSKSNGKRSGRDGWLRTFCSSICSGVIKASSSSSSRAAASAFLALETAFLALFTASGLFLGAAALPLVLRVALGLSTSSRESPNFCSHACFSSASSFSRCARKSARLKPSLAAESLSAVSWSNFSFCSRAKRCLRGRRARRFASSSFASLSALFFVDSNQKREYRNLHAPGTHSAPVAVAASAMNKNRQRPQTLTSSRASSVSFSHSNGCIKVSCGGSRGLIKTKKKHQDGHARVQTWWVVRTTRAWQGAQERLLNRLSRGG